DGEGRVRGDQGNGDGEVKDGEGRVRGDQGNGDGGDVQYIHNIPPHELARTAGRCVLVDPGRRDLLFCMKETSTPAKPEVYRYTANQKARETRSRRYRKIRDKIKRKCPDCDVQAAENSLAEVSHKTLNPHMYQRYIAARSVVWPLLSGFYAKTKTIHPRSGHPMHDQTHHVVREPEGHPVHRKLRLSAYVNQKQADARLARNLRKKFGKDAVLVMGNWGAPHAKFQEPIRGKGMRHMLRQHGFEVYLIDEYRTSKNCPACIIGTLSTFKQVKNPRPYRRRSTPKVVCHGLLSCKNENCLESATNGSLVTPPRMRMWNRDLAAVLNFRHILNGLREAGVRPARFVRQPPKDNDKRPLLKRKLMATNTEQVKRQRNDHIYHEFYL
ncbi:hypothetical protein IWQ62_003611, partial [Dispira parvispora]